MLHGVRGSRVSLLRHLPTAHHLSTVVPAHVPARLHTRSCPPAVRLGWPAHYRTCSIVSPLHRHDTTTRRSALDVDAHARTFCPRSDAHFSPPLDTTAHRSSPWTLTKWTAPTRTPTRTQVGRFASTRLTDRPTVAECTTHRMFDWFAKLSASCASSFQPPGMGQGRRGAGAAGWRAGAPGVCREACSRLMDWWIQRNDSGLGWALAGPGARLSRQQQQQQRLTRNPPPLPPLHPLQPGGAAEAWEQKFPDTA